MNQEIFDKIANQFGCGYWHVCDDHACGCSPNSAVGKGFSIETYESMARQQAEDIKQWEKELAEWDYYEENNWYIEDDEEDGLYWAENK